jgi:hypothetical protein
MQFFKADGTTAVMNIDTTNSRIGIGTTAPTSTLHVVSTSADATKPAFIVENNRGVINGAFIQTTTSSTIAGGGMVGISDDGAAMGSGDRLGYFAFGGAYDATHTYVYPTNMVSYTTEAWSSTNHGAALAFFTTPNGFTTASRAERMRIDNNGKVGIGTTAPSAKLHALATTEQLRLGYDASNYLSATVGSTGSTTFALTGTTPIFTFSQAVKFSGGTQSSDGSAGLSATYNIDGSAAGTVATMTFKNGLLTAVTTR